MAAQQVDFPTPPFDEANEIIMVLQDHDAPSPQDSKPRNTQIQTYPDLISKIFHLAQIINPANHDLSTWANMDLPRPQTPGSTQYQKAKRLLSRIPIAAFAPEGLLQQPQFRTPRGSNQTDHHAPGC
ncbi:MAG: hypothetical protein KDJ36_00110 [Hyphomicrobiaceae bacterium]|nr:hypothetical protein [Hyphomicrobiaceae bacterium]